MLFEASGLCSIINGLTGNFPWHPIAALCHEDPATLGHQDWPSHLMSLQITYRVDVGVVLGLDRFRVGQPASYSLSLPPTQSDQSQSPAVIAVPTKASYSQATLSFQYYIIHKCVVAIYLLDVKIPAQPTLPRVCLGRSVASPCLSDLSCQWVCLYSDYPLISNGSLLNYYQRNEVKKDNCHINYPEHDKHQNHKDSIIKGRQNPCRSRFSRLTWPASRFPVLFYCDSVPRSHYSSRSNNPTATMSIEHNIQHHWACSDYRIHLYSP